MANPVELRIVQSLQTALRSISIAGGYWHDVQSLAVKLDIDANVEDLIKSDAPRPFVVLEPVPEEITYPERPNHIRLLAPFIIHFVDDTDPTDDAAMLEKYYKAIADVETAITQNIRRGELATDTLITNREKHKAAEGQRVWVQVTAEVIINRTYGAPNG